jgi:glycosyltransferase involved in cell wall biosynthesis
MLGDITIVIPTFHRRGYLRDCLAGIRENLPECDVIVVSDDGVIPQTANEIYLPYDSGLTAKRNAGVAQVQTRYTLIGSDDFDFSTDEAREGIIKMEKALSSSEVNMGYEIDVVAGRVNDRCYEGTLEYVPGEYIKEHRRPLGDLPFRLLPFKLWKVDIAANYFLARTSILRAVPWDESIVKIGGEHVDFFLDLKAAKIVVAFLQEANINQMEYDASKQDPRYKAFRQRALTTGHALMMKKRGIKKYFGFDEEVKL